MLELIRRYFDFEGHRTDFKAEILGGVTTFMTMAYIIVVNPGILSDTQIGAGMDFHSVMMATCLASALACLVMAFAARYPVALAPGMGLNAFFSFEIVRAFGVPWETALGMVFIAGCAFMILTFLKVRELLINAIPDSLKHAIAAGIGMFIAFIGLQHAGLIVTDQATLVGMGDISDPSVMIALASLAAAAMMMAAGVRGAVLWGILIAAALGLLFGVIEPAKMNLNIKVPTLRPFTWPGLFLVFLFFGSLVPLRAFKVRGAALIAALVPIAVGWAAGWVSLGIVSRPPSIAPTAFQLDIASVFMHWEWIALCFVLLFFDLFDTVGTLIGVSEQAGLLKDGKLPRATPALSADAFGTVAGSLMGTSTVTSYIESSAGVAAGARTGFATIVTALLFVAAIFFSPLVSLLAVSMVTAPALIIVGCLMMGSVARINWKEFAEAAPAFLTITIMPFSFSISRGLLAGFIAWPLCQVAAKKGRSVHPFMFGLMAVLLVAVSVHYLFMARIQPDDIHAAAGRGDRDAIESILEKDPAAVSALDGEGRTPLHLAARSGQAELVELLLSAGAEVKAADDQCRTPLHEAAAAGSLPVVERLLSAGAAVNDRDRQGMTPLKLAAEGGHKEAERALVDGGAVE